MIKKLQLFALLFFACTCASVHAQGDLQVINHTNALQAYSDKYPVEKVHLHLDRPWYGLGDTIWFKAYTVVGAEHRLSALSGALYAELINDKDSVVRRLTLGISSGVSMGEFILPFNYKSGVYRLRAYTNWMRNAGADYFYDQKIIVSGLNSIETKGNKPNAVLSNSAAQAKPGSIDVQFFPEGGDLVNGLRSKIAVKAVNTYGLSEEIQGVITDAAGNELASFSTQHLGMGQFALMPQKGERYKAKITAANGSSFTVDLPAAKDAGFALAINNNNTDSLYLKVAANNQLYQSKQDTAFSLIAQSGGKVYFAASGKLGARPFTAPIAKSRFPSGIVQFTLFSQSGEPLNERIIFIQNPDQLNVALATGKQSYAPGERVKINIDAKNETGKATVGTFSVSVTDETKVPVDEQAESTIFTDLLLKSDLAGYIENPSYYFINPDDKTRSDLDVLMLTQGYRRFEWKKILSGNAPATTWLPETGVTLAGTVKTPAGKPIAKGEVIITSLKDKFVLDTLADENGNFSFSNIALPDTASVIVNAKKANGGNNVKIYIRKPAYPAVTKSEDIGASPGKDLSISNTEYTNKINQVYRSWHDDSLSHVIQLKEVNVNEKKQEFKRPDYAASLKYSANLNGPGMADQVLLTNDIFMGCANLVDCLQGRLFGVTFSNGVAFSLRAITRHLMGPAKPMAIYVNGAETPAYMLNTINPMDVQGIEVLTSAMYLNMYGTDAFGGALLITLKNGSSFDSNELSAPKGLVTYKFPGYYKAREFYSPKYDSKKTVSLADKRKTIYWNPGIISDANGTASFEYFNAGSKGTYRVVVEGIDGDGKLGRQVLNYNVQ